MAEPDAIVVSDSTRHQLGRLFDMDDLGPIKLKGFGAHQRAWRVRCETALSSRSEALYGDTLTPLIGRDEELDQLLAGGDKRKRVKARSYCSPASPVSASRV